MWGEKRNHMHKRYNVKTKEKCLRHLLKKSVQIGTHEEKEIF